MIYSLHSMKLWTYENLKDTIYWILGAAIISFLK